VGDDAGIALTTGARAVMPMRVLLISAEYPPTPGGVGDYTALLATHLAAAGATVTVLTSGSGGTEQVGAITVLRRVPRWGWAIADIVHGVIRSVRPDVVHLQYQTGMYGMHPAMNFLPDRLSWYVPVLHVLRSELSWEFRFIATFHDLRTPYLFPKAGPLRTFVVQHLARVSKVAIATNGADYATLKGWRANVALIPIGSNIPAASGVDTQIVRSQYGIASDAVLLTTFGLLNQSKGIDTVLDALAILQRGGARVHLLLVGAGAGANDPTNRATETALDAQIAANGLTGSVTRTGPLPAGDVARALAASDVCLLPYRDGASPRRGSLLAALTQGVPVITTEPSAHAYDGLPALNDNEDTLFVPSGDRDALANAVLRILNDGSLASRLRLGAAAYAAQFAWPTIADKTLALYGTLGVPARADHVVASVAAGSDH
jgi:glycosyltransferase involved in cell wall biosynthesis